MNHDLMHDAFGGGFGFGDDGDSLWPEAVAVKEEPRRFHSSSTSSPPPPGDDEGGFGFGGLGAAYSLLGGAASALSEWHGERKRMRGAEPPPQHAAPATHAAGHAGAPAGAVQVGFGFGRPTAAARAVPAGTVALEVTQQPPAEVRTRTPSEVRLFGMNVRIIGDFAARGVYCVRATLVYGDNGAAVGEGVLGGKTQVPVKAGGFARFTALTVAEASTKHKERAFALKVEALDAAGAAIGGCAATSRPFYAYTHMKVLQRRKSLALRCLSTPEGSVLGGQRLHLVGSPFIKGPSLQVFVDTPHGRVSAESLELFSDSVLFFDLPPYPNLPACAELPPGTRIPVHVACSNYGGLETDPLVFHYVVDVPASVLVSSKPQQQ